MLRNKSLRPDNLVCVYKVFDVSEPTYIAIDLKSFYASVECIDRQLNPLSTHLVVANEERTEKTICLAVSPSLKAYGISGRARLFEVLQRVREVNAMRRRNAPNRQLIGKSSKVEELQAHPALALDYLVAMPRMARYIEVSTQIYAVYLKYVAPEDIHVYSIDEVFIDATAYLKLYQLSAYAFAKKLILDVFQSTGVTATAGIGTNLYLCKVAMDIRAKHIPADQDGVRIAFLDEATYRQVLWTHRPLTDFWRVGRGIANRLEAAGMQTMGDVARMSIRDEDLLYRMFGTNAELLIDHAWGVESTTIADIKAYTPENNSICQGQVLHTPYPYEKARLVVKEMADLLALSLVERRQVTNQLVLNVAYDISNLSDPSIRSLYIGPIKTDGYGRQAPADTHGSINLEQYTSSANALMLAVTQLFDRIVHRDLLVRKISITANHVVNENQQDASTVPQQLDLFTDYEALQQEEERLNAARKKEHCLQETVLAIKKQFGKNAILKAMNLEDGATTKERNLQIGGHRA